MNKARPKNLNLLTISMPITAVASILHRITGVIVWVGIGFLLAAAAVALKSPEAYSHLVQVLDTQFIAQFVAWGLGTATGYYCFATIKHLVQDAGYCESFEGGKAISWVVLVAGVIFAVFMGVLVWA